MYQLEDLPNEVFLIILSYFNKFELSQSFLDLNQRFTHLITKYLHHIHFSSKYRREDLIQLLVDKIPVIQKFIYSLSIDNETVGKYFLENSKTIQLENLFCLQLVDQGIDLLDDFSLHYQPEVLTIIQTPFYQQTKRYSITSTSLKYLQIDVQTEGFIADCLLQQLDLPLTSVLVHLRLSLLKLSSYFQLFYNGLTIPIEKLILSILSIDRDDIHSFPTINLPKLVEFQLETCPISFCLLGNLLPSNLSRYLKRFAFTGQTNNCDAQSWKSLLRKYLNIDCFDLQLFNCTNLEFSDLQQWNLCFPNTHFEFNPIENTFRTCFSKFDQIDRLLVTESVQDFDHIYYPNQISHLIIRSQYWSTYFNLSLKMQEDLLKRFNCVRRLSISYRQLRPFVKKNFLSRIEQLDLEFAEKYCLVEDDIAQEFTNLKSIQFSSMYEGYQQMNLHTTIKDVLLNKFAQVCFLSIDAIRIIDEPSVEDTVHRWYSHESSVPLISYRPGKSFSIWF